MNKRFFFTVGVLLGGAFGISCVSPFYGTARIEPGWHMDAGIAATTYVAELAWRYPYSIGCRGDLELRYGFNKYMQMNAQAGLGIGFSLSSWSDPSYRGGDVYPLLDGVLGIQTALPVGFLTPALRMEFSYFLGEPELVSTALLGIGLKERFTLGGRLHLDELIDPYSLDAFVGFHPSSKWSMFAGIKFFFHGYDITYPPVATLGVGYKLR